MTEEKWRPYPTPPPEVAPLLERYEGSRTDLYGRVITAVEETWARAQKHGDTHYVRRVEEELWPFLKAEQERAAEEEGLRPLLDWQKSLLS